MKIPRKGEVIYSEKFGKLTERIMATAGDGIPSEIEYFNEKDEVVGFWAYGSWHPDYPYQGEKTFSLRQKELFDWQGKNFPDSIFDDMTREDLIKQIRIFQVLTGVNEEAGELSHNILKASQRIREGIAGFDKEQISDDICDIWIFSIQLMSLLGIDAEEAFAKTVNEVLARDWNKSPENGQI